MTITAANKFLLENFAETTLAQALTATGLSAVVSAVTNFPTLTGANAGKVFRVTLYDGTNDPEIIEVTTATGSTTWTVVRAKEGTSAASWSAGTLVRLAPTAEVLEGLAAVPANGVQFFPRDITEDISLASGFGAFSVGARLATGVTASIATDAVWAVAANLTLATGATLSVATGAEVIILGGATAT